MADPLKKVSERPGAPLAHESEAPRIPLVVFGWSFGLFLAIAYVLCAGFDLLFPGQAMYQTWLRLLPGFTWLRWPSFVLGLVKSCAYGGYVALVFCPLFNFFAARFKS